MSGLNELRAVIARIPAWQGVSGIQVERIAGLTNANYRVTVADERFVLRISGQNTAHLGINRRHEVAALQAAGAAGIAPEMLAFLEPEGHLVTRWVEGRHWTTDEFRTPEHVRLLTRVVKRLHTLPSNGAVFSPFQRVSSFMKTAQQLGVKMPQNLEPFWETLHAVAGDQQGDTSDWQRFCHNDLVSVNYLFVEQEATIKVLDWEFSGLGDIYYDLATIVYTHDSDGPIPPSLENEMLDEYFGSVSTFQYRRLSGMKFMLMLFTGAWALAQHGMQLAGWIPAVEGFDYLEFGDYLFTHDIPELQEQYHGVQQGLRRGAPNSDVPQN